MHDPFASVSRFGSTLHNTYQTTLKSCVQPSILTFDPSRHLPSLQLARLLSLYPSGISCHTASYMRMSVSMTWIYLYDDKGEAILTSS